MTNNPIVTGTRKAHPGQGLRVAFDIGGTFTDVIIATPAQQLFRYKILTLPDSIGEDVSACIVDAQSRRDAASIAATDKTSSELIQVDSIVHGTTVAANAVLEQKGARVGLITTEGFRDELEIRRLGRPGIYSVFWERNPPLIPRRLRLEVPERLTVDGHVDKALDHAAVQAAAESLRGQNVEAVAIAFLHAYANPEHEQAALSIVRAVLPDVSICTSADVLPEVREYERTSTTALNAYLMPVVGRYLNVLERALARFGNDLRIMQSNGGIMSAARTRERPVNMIESGPAAGVLAAAALADKIGLAQVVSFDMGGTTAKACLIEDGTPVETSEGEVGAGINLASRLNKGAGYALRVPAFDIAEVGAGGGSLAWVDDGGVLRVGPQSAGAEPGPAAYGRGGTAPTITDANVALGYMNPVAIAGGHVAIDTDAMERAFAPLCTRLGLSLYAAAYGVHQVANATMSRAIRAVTTERGRDPREFDLIAFGGSGAIHALSLAESLGIRSVCVPLHPGLFSALGLLMADMRYDFVQSVQVDLDDAGSAVLSAAFSRLEAHALSEFRHGEQMPAEELAGSSQAPEQLSQQAVLAAGQNTGVDNRFDDAAGDQSDGPDARPGGHRPAVRPVVHRFVDLRYSRQSSDLTLALPDSANLEVPLTEALTAAFHAEHERTYGYSRQGESISVVSARVRLTAPVHQFGFTDLAASFAQELREIELPDDTDNKTRSAYFGPDHGEHEARVLTRVQLFQTATEGLPLEGPMIIEEFDTTVVVPPGWFVYVDKLGNIRLRRDSSTVEQNTMTTDSAAPQTRAMTVESGEAQDFDPILVEVMKNELTAIAEEMGITMKRTARSLVAKEGADFSTALTDADGQLIAQGLTIGIHLGYIAGVMPWLLKRYANTLKPGDIIASNDPYGGLSHLPDIVLVMPVFWQEQLVGFSAIVAHHTDIGGRFPGGMGTACENLYQEGVRIPGVKLFEGGVRNEALVELLAANVRAPDDLLGDLDAQVAACQRGAEGIQRIVSERGLRQFTAINSQLRTYSERAMRATIAQIPDGEYVVEDLFEDDGLGGRGVDIRLSLQVEGDGVTVDFHGTGDQISSAMNVPVNLTRACVYVAFRSVLDTDAPANAGLTAPITVHVPEGSALNPTFPGAVGARGMMMWRIIDMIFAALTQADPSRVYAAGEGGMNLLVYSPEGPDAGTQMLVDIYAGGWGARPTLDGIEGVTPMAAGGATRSLPAEMIERECPVMLEGFGFVPDTGGAGQFRGALSVWRQWRFLRQGRAMLRNCRVKSVPYGLAGGEDGTAFSAVLETSSGAQETTC